MQRELAGTPSGAGVPDLLRQFPRPAPLVSANPRRASSMSKGESIPWLPCSACERVSERGTTRIERSAAMQIGRGGCLRLCAAQQQGGGPPAWRSWPGSSTAVVCVCRSAVNLRVKDVDFAQGLVFDARWQEGRQGPPHREAAAAPPRCRAEKVTATLRCGRWRACPGCRPRPRMWTRPSAAKGER